jgi:hypothetical protein
MLVTHEIVKRSMRRMSKEELIVFASSLMHIITTELKREAWDKFTQDYFSPEFFGKDSKIIIPIGGKVLATIREVTREMEDNGEVERK